MNTNDPYQLITIHDIEEQLKAKLRSLRLAANWKQATLAERSGVSLGSLRRFESTGNISLQNLLKLAWALGRLEDFTSVLEPPEVMSLRELEESHKAPARKRGTK